MKFWCLDCRKEIIEFSDKFQAKKEVIHRDKRQITEYLLNPKTLIKLVEKYNISLSIDHILYQDRPTLEDNKDDL